MKNYFILNLVLLFTTLSAQKVSDYKYISIPEKFSDFDKGQYQLENYMRLLISQKDYEVLPEMRTYWPEEARLNPCLVLNADLLNTSSAFKNKLEASFKDCNQVTVAKLEGESGIKDFSEGFKDALKTAVNLMPKQAAVMPTYREAENKQVTIVKTTETENPGTELFRQYSKQPGSNEAEQTVTVDKTAMDAYEYNGQTVYKSDLPNGEFTIIDASKSKILALYSPSTRPGIYHVKVNSGNTSYLTIGYYENGELSYEYSADAKNWTLIKFNKK